MQAIAPSNSSTGEVQASQELRFLPVNAIIMLSRILESNPGWKQIMGLVPSSPWKPGDPIPAGDQYPKKYTWDDIKTITEECSRSGREGFQVLLEEWGTSGRQRPTVQDLVNLLQKTKLYRALDYLTVNVMNGETLPRDESHNAVEELNWAIENERFHENVVFGTHVVSSKDIPMTAPTAEAFNVNGGNFNKPIDDSTRLIDSRDVDPVSQAAQTPVFDSDLLEGMDSGDTFHFGYSCLKTITNDFSDIPFSEGGNKLGEGAFGKVYFAKITHRGREKEVAVKRLHACTVSESRIELQFKTEVEILSKCNHENLVPLEGYSCDGPEWCLVYAFMPGGSLLDCLSCADGRPPLDWKTRLRIGEGSARGIVHLHTYQERPFVHRDIKSANILLDENMTPKVGDFGLVRLGGSGNNTRTLVKTTTMLGTPAYMAPEAFRGDVSIKMDTFSFGMVLLELLTGLIAFDEDREEPDLLNYVLETRELEDGPEELADSKGGDWDMDIFNELLDLAELCCTEMKKKRPTMVELLEKYSSIIKSIN
ncbi:interleukin-1 receptor-associated kinase 4-like [Palaemon carinicauda]|uniref:interleukin-1 receptor-associated kinase 4-like n=1 Tax=Palaemon carinicauda TaxID=392227 RepID=UPI0035B6111C